MKYITNKLLVYSSVFLNKNNTLNLIFANKKCDG